MNLKFSLKIRDRSFWFKYLSEKLDEVYIDSISWFNTNFLFIKINVDEIALHAKKQERTIPTSAIKIKHIPTPLGQANHSYIADILYEQILVCDAESIRVHQDY